MVCSGAKQSGANGILVVCAHGGSLSVARLGTQNMNCF